jgi:hypothetical protein
MGWDGGDPGKCGNDGGEARKRGSEEARKRGSEEVGVGPLAVRRRLWLLESFESLPPCKRRRPRSLESCLVAA